MAKLIPLTQGKFAIIDDSNYQWLSQMKWYPQKRGNTYYAISSISENGKQKSIAMHRMILKSKPHQITDHINNNGLDNRIANLRFCSSRQNSQNRTKASNCSSKYKGVCWHKRKKKWEAYLMQNNNKFHLGYFVKEENAAKAYNKKAKELFKEFAYINQVQDGASDTKKISENVRKSDKWK